MKVDRLTQLLHRDDSVITSSLCIVLFVLWIWGMIAPIGYLFALIPGQTIYIYTYFWAPATAGFYHSSFILGLLNICLVWLMGPMLERVWPGLLLLRFVVIVNVSTYLTLFALSITAFAMSQNENYLYQQLCGFTPANAALLVALKQRYANQYIPIPNFQILQYKYLPALVCCLTLILASVGFEVKLIQILLGTFFGWLYLRFYMFDEEAGQIGDSRPEFSFASLFPDVLHIPAFITFLSTIVFNFFLRLGMFRDAGLRKELPLHTSDVTAPVMSFNTSQDDYFAKPLFNFGPSDPTAERRRALAMKAIDEKLAQLSKQSNSNETSFDFPDIPHDISISDSHLSSLPSEGELDIIRNSNQN